MNEKEGRRLGFIREITGCLTSPRSSFKSILEKPSLMKATALILVIAIVAAWASSNYMRKLPLNSAQPRTPVIVAATIGLIGVFGTWLISSVILHVFSSALRGKGAFKSMLTLAGYASAPLLIQQVLRLAYSFMASQEGLLQLAASLQISAYPLLNRTAGAAIDIFTIFRLWTIALLVVAVRKNYNISTTRSIVAIVLSYILIVFFSVFLPLK